MTLSITSDVFTNGGNIPAGYTCQGQDIAPPLRWTGVPDATKSLVLIVDDPDAPDPKAPRMTWVHWVLYNIPPDTEGLPEGVAASDLPSGYPRGIERLEAHRVWRSLPAHRPASLFPQALRPGHPAAGSEKADQDGRRISHEGARDRPGGAGGDLREKPLAGRRLPPGNRFLRPALRWSRNGQAKKRQSR
jgi:hypothetical protein